MHSNVSKETGQNNTYKREDYMSLVDFQKAIGVKADGEFGPNTFKAAIPYLRITPVQAVHFFAQTGHETGGFKVFSENLNYSSKGLMSTFKKYFPTQAIAKQYERKPEAIANHVYANRMGNGPEKTGDGWKYRGRGALQLTGKENYKAFADYLKNQVVLVNPDLVASQYAFDSAMFFFRRNGLWSICNQGLGHATIVAVTLKVNGGTNGLAEREALTNKYAAWI